MRPIILTVMLTFASVSAVAAQSVPTFPTMTYPEEGNFCGLLTLCPKAKATLPQSG